MLFILLLMAGRLLSLYS
uniref:Uncharacterized protein n=1 Tax=Arundo donax TaxID=35708 RepID=A0A0A8Y1Y5_ARUDO